MLLFKRGGVVGKKKASLSNNVFNKNMKGQINNAKNPALGGISKKIQG